MRTRALLAAFLLLALAGCGGTPETPLATPTGPAFDQDPLPDTTGPRSDPQDYQIGGFLGSGSRNPQDTTTRESGSLPRP